jgi:hypothetical protein
MKKALVISLVFLSLAFSLYAQTRTRWSDIEKYLQLFEVDLKVWFDDQTKFFYFEDESSKNFDDMLFQWTYTMQAIDFMLVDRGVNFEELRAEKFLYTWYQPGTKYEIIMEKSWLIVYFDPATNRKDRSNMIMKLYDFYYKKWSAALKKKF